MKICVTRTFNKGNYENIKISLENEVPPGKTVDEYFNHLDRCIDFLYKQHEERT